MEALTSQWLWEDDSPDFRWEDDSWETPEDRPGTYGDTGFNFDKVLESSFYGAVSAVAFAFGEMAADPSRGSLDDLWKSIAWAVFGTAFSELANYLTGSNFWSVIIVGFVTGFLVVALHEA
ncbi:MAG: hypothetical protein ACOX5Q_04130 [Bacillota bacterium]|jgi:hypothetical protein